MKVQHDFECYIWAVRILGEHGYVINEQLDSDVPVDEEAVINAARLLVNGVPLTDNERTTIVKKVK